MKLREEIISHLGLKGLSISLKCQRACTEHAHTPKKSTILSLLHACKKRKLSYYSLVFFAVPPPPPPPLFMCTSATSPVSPMELLTALHSESPNLCRAQLAFYCMMTKKNSSNSLHPHKYGHARQHQHRHTATESAAVSPVKRSAVAFSR